MKWFIKCIKNYANFKGRARRSEYWYFILFSVIIMLVLRIIDIAVFGLGGLHGESVYPISSIFALFLILPQAAVMVRRLHDTARSGMRVLWLWVLALVIGFLSGLLAPDFEAMAYGAPVVISKPLLYAFTIGAFGLFVWSIFFLIWFCQEGTRGENKYGPDPKQVENQ